MALNPPSILRIERLNYALSAAVILASLALGSRSITLGVAIGAALTCINFYVLRKLIVRWTSAAAQGKVSNAPLLMLPKMLGLMGACAVAILLLPIDAIAFAIGYSIFIVSILIETTYSAIRGVDPDAAPTDEHEKSNG